MLKRQLSLILDICTDYKESVSQEQLIALSNVPHFKITDALNMFYAAPNANQKYVLQAILNKEFISSSMYLKLIYYVANYDANKMQDLLDIINCYQITKMPNFQALIDLFYEVTNSSTYMAKKSDESILLLVDDSKTIPDILPEKIVARIKRDYNKFISEYDLIHFEDTELNDEIIEHLNAEFLIHSPEEKISTEKLILERKAKIVKFDKIS